MERVRSLILVKIESTYGTDSSPAAATDAIITKGEPSFSIEGEAKTREISLAHFGVVAPVNVGTGLKLSFTTELKGSGQAGVPSRYSGLFRACNMTESIIENTSVNYTLNSVLDGESVTLYYYNGGTLHKIMGCVGTFSAALSAGEIPTIEWEFTGLYGGYDHASDVVFPKAVHETVPPITWKNANFLMGDISGLVVTEMGLELGNKIVKRTDGNSANNGVARYVISNRESKGNVTIEKELLTKVNPWNYYDKSTQFNLETKPTLNQGNTFEINVTGATLEAPGYGDRENIITWPLSFSINPTINTGNNEIEITFK